MALGANLPGDRSTPDRTLTKALCLLAANAIGGVWASRLFSTPAMPTGSGPDYLNAAASFRWSGTPEALLSLLHGIEADLGRTRDGRWTARIIDLDLIALDDAVCPDRAVQAHWAAMPLERASVEVPDRLILPHPRMAERSFVLVPLADVAPDWRHPVNRLSVAQMLAARPAPERAGIVAVPWPDGDAPSPLSFAPPGDT
nr:2-amino-4-hydroxy-6-hydroxymethyldihydropteridine diphosphokinase [Roseicyclus mahoneyensis]